MSSKHICIGIHAHEQPEQLLATLESVRRHTASSVRLILLPDGPDAHLRQALRGLSEIPQLGTEEPLGPPACFNRLAAATDAEVLVLLESGAQVGPAWLEHLLAALAADKRNGLAGPSTNRIWNAQCAFPHCGDSAAEIARTADLAARRFGSTTRTLEPLYSLADFCYVVRREVVEALGSADERYGLGPCWEMDYNIRAARAGFRSVWALAAYVHRAPFTARRQRQETRRFEASKHLYQDKFCGLRLRGEKTDYRPHCRGDACPNFAPAALIERWRPIRLHPGDTPEPLSQPPLPSQAPVRSTESQEPLVSCIMPTYNRRPFVPQAIRCFLRQDYPNAELVIVDDSTPSIADLVPNEPRIRHIRLGTRHTIGAKRNLACEQARGEVVVHWDDDDWYPPWRVRVQVRALLDHHADLCGSSRVFYYEAAANRAWRYEYPQGRGAPWVAGNTLAYRKSLWARNRFPDIQVGEDTRFVGSGMTKAIHDLRDPAICIASMHSRNTSRKVTSGAYWVAQSMPQIRKLLGDDRHFYESAINLMALDATAPQRASSREELPLVSCIMPTNNRRAFLPLALRCFTYQDYPNKELVIIDDGTDSVRDLTDGLPGVRYLRLSTRTAIGGKRNLACKEARGEIIAHWDDDDWYAPDRLRYQIAPLLAHEADLTGLENAFILELPSGVFWTTRRQLHQRMFVGDIHGGTLVYRKELLEQGLRYPEINLAEDAMLIRQAMSRGKRLVRLANPGLFVYVRHGRNAWRECAPGHFLDPTGWQRIEQPRMVPADAIVSYQAAATVIG
ncbi:MAG TPA: glycosyltransferase [Candidatus Tectomicrobia bacterium]|nr:glycosyltransferase [Candidatus Tectomicrobia bacterium]